MTPRPLALALLIPFAGTALAEGITLSSPIDCDLSDDCYIQQYVDRDPGPGAQDFRCSPLSYDGHKGTDFALPTKAGIANNVPVIAAAAGKVVGHRDGMADVGVTDRNRAALAGRECGNGVVIDHGEGWQTQYCHLKQGSITVSKGDSVQTGAVLGHVGQSGMAEFPHVHLSVRKDGQVIDPFDPDGKLTCDAPGDSSLWADPPPYRAGGVLDAGFADHVPAYDTIKAGKGVSVDLTTESGALVIYGYFFGIRENDTLRLNISGPLGTVIEDDIVMTKTQAQAFRAIGKKRPGTGWATGTYSGTVEMTRENRIIDQKSVTIQLK